MPQGTLEHGKDEGNAFVQWRPRHISVAQLVTALWQRDPNGHALTVKWPSAPLWSEGLSEMAPVAPHDRLHSDPQLGLAPGDARVPQSTCLEAPT